MRLTPFVVLATIVSACSSYGADNGTSGNDAGTVDSGSPAADAGGSGACDTPFELAVIVPDGNDPCPVGTTEKLVHTNAREAMAGACTCGDCTPGTTPLCAANVTQMYGGSNTCPNTYTTFGVSDGACTDFNAGTFTTDAFNKWTAVTPKAGTCSAQATADPSKVVTDKLRHCVADSQAAFCSAVARGSRACIPATTGGSCVGAYTIPVVVADAPSLTCTCTCSRKASQCVVEYHGNSTCTDLRYTTALDGQCKATGNAPNVNHFKVYPENPTCDVTPAVMATGLTNPRTICCKP